MRLFYLTFTLWVNLEEFWNRVDNGERNTVRFYHTGGEDRYKNLTNEGKV